MWASEWKIRLFLWEIRGRVAWNGNHTRLVSQYLQCFQFGDNSFVRAQNESSAGGSRCLLYVDIKVNQRQLNTPWSLIFGQTHFHLRPIDTVSQAYFALHKTLHEVENFQEKKIFGTKVTTSEAFLRISQNSKVTGLQRGTQTKLWTCWRNVDLSRPFERFFFFWARSWLCCAPVDGLTKHVVKQNA